MFGVQLQTLEEPALRPDLECPVLEFAASGAMWLTGWAAGPPIPVAAPVIAHLRALARGIGELSTSLGRRVVVDPARELTERAATRGFRRAGQTSANGSSRFVRARDQWVAVTLARESDRELVPAMTGGSEAEPWTAVVRAAHEMSARELCARGLLVGIPTAALGMADSSSAVPLRSLRLGLPSSSRASAPVVVDFSALWAGPLCAHILGAAGARVIKVEDPERPDGARLGDRHLFERLHAGHEVASIRLRTPGGRRTVQELVDSADVVVEASRPRALAQLGLCPARFLQARSGRTWISITGYGRSGDLDNAAAFGDDAAVAGGLVAWAAPDVPVFCADAVADPISGLYGAFGGLGSMAAGGGYVVDVTMSAASAFVIRGPHCPARHVVEQLSPDEWRVSHDDRYQEVVRPRSSVAVP